jgi:hypothetical protein
LAFFAILLHWALALLQSTRLVIFIYLFCFFHKCTAVTPIFIWAIAFSQPKYYLIQQTFCSSNSLI